VSEQVTGIPPTSRRWRAIQPAAVLWLTLVWMALWGDVSVANALSGALLGVVVCMVFPLPRVRGPVRPRPFLVLGLLVHFTLDVLRASAQVIRVILAPGDLRNSVVEVDLRSRSELVLTIVAEMTSLVPGSLVVEVRRSSHTLFLHVLDTPDGEAVRRMHDRTLALEQRVLTALGVPQPQPEVPLPEGGER
jgi:multicomponent Na+:H+ antiporter subunit E